MPEELKPCPFCGGRAAFSMVPHDVPDASAGGEFVECVSCGSSTNLRYSLKDDCRPLLAEQWNRRAAPEPADRTPNPDEVICPACTHQFRAIPENVQAELYALRAAAPTVVEPEPVAHICILPTKDAGPTKFFTAPSDPRGFPVFAHPPRTPLTDAELERLKLCEKRLAAVTRWLEANQPDVFRRGIWDAVIAASEGERK